MKSPLFVVLAAMVCAPSAFAGGVCSAVHAPVCAVKKDGQRADFDNSCRAKKAGAEILHSGNCEAPGRQFTMCSHLYQPVCAIDPATGAQKTYANLCTSELTNAKSVHDKACAGSQ